VVSIALAVAVTKGTLVALFFMHLIDERRLIYYTLVLVVLLFVPLLALPNLTEGEHLNNRIQREKVMPGTEAGGEHHVGGEGPKTEAPTPTPADVHTTASEGPKVPVTVTVSYAGKAPARKQLPVGADPFCVKYPTLSEDVLVNEGKVANVFVHVTRGAAASYPAPAAPVIVGQEKCMYRPRVQGALAGSTIEIKFLDPIQHNTHPWKGDESLFNVAKQGGSITKSTSDFNTDDGMVTFKCDIHPWMTGYLYVSRNPYFATTDEKGTAKLELPAGKYTLEAWHEKLGTKSQDVTVEAGKPAEVKFDFGAS
jgi:plastocyanin